jgi:hypothetical protein
MRPMDSPAPTAWQAAMDAELLTFRGWRLLTGCIACRLLARITVDQLLQAYGDQCVV